MDVPGTRKTILKKLRMTQMDQDAWKEFYAIYCKLVFNVALQAGLSHADAEEVVQNTFIKVGKNIQKFEYDPHKGKFRNWLCLIAKQQAANLFRKPSSNVSSSGRSKAISDAEIQCLPDKANDWDAIWDEEEKRHLLAIALARAKTKVNPKQFRVFYAHCIKGLGTKEVIGLLEVSANEVYLAKHRVMPIFEDELRQVQQDENERDGSKAD